MIISVVLLFMAAPLILTRTRDAGRIDAFPRKAIQASLLFAMLLSVGLGMAVDPRQDDRVAREPAPRTGGETRL